MEVQSFYNRHWEFFLLRHPCFRGCRHCNRCGEQLVSVAALRLKGDPPNKVYGQCLLGCGARFYAVDIPEASKDASFHASPSLEASLILRITEGNRRFEFTYNPERFYLWIAQPARSLEKVFYTSVHRFRWRHWRNARNMLKRTSIAKDIVPLISGFLLKP